MIDTYFDTLVSPTYVASATFAGFTHREAVDKIAKGVFEPSIGMLSSDKIQLCPQNHSTLNEEVCSDLILAYSQTEFRIHANTSCGGLFGIYDASSDWSNTSFLAWKKQLAIACKRLNAKAYSWHAGRAKNANLDDAIKRTLDLEQELGICVGVEGLYPSSSTSWLMSSFNDYEKVMNSGASYVIDLSHWQIITKAMGKNEESLLKDLLIHPNCMEIHISDNDGKRDNHGKLSRKPFWFYLLCELQAKSLIKADVFSEGIQEFKRDISPEKKSSFY